MGLLVGIHLGSQPVGEGQALVTGTLAPLGQGGWVEAKAGRCGLSFWLCHWLSKPRCGAGFEGAEPLTSPHLR